MKVLHIGKFFPPHRGGMETYLRDLCCVQAAHLDVTALVHRSEASLFDLSEVYCADGGGNVQIRRTARWFNVGFIPVSPFFLISLERTLTTVQPDLLHLHHPNASLIWLLLSPSARKLPWVSTWHSDIDTPGVTRMVSAAYSLYRPIEQALLRRSQAIIATSQTYLEGSEALKPHQHQHKCTVVPLGLYVPRLPSQRAFTSVKELERPQLLFVGRLAFYKGVDVLIKSLTYLSDCQLTVVGDGPERLKLKTLVEDLQLTTRVRFLSNLGDTDLWEMYDQCDIVCLPSVDKTEAFGVVLLEALHMGKPVVATEIPGSGVPWVASHAARYKIAPPRNAKALANESKCRHISEPPEP